MGIEEQHRRVLDLVGHLYDAALDDSLLPSLATRIATCFEAQSTVVALRRVPTGIGAFVTQTDNYSAKNVEAYNAHYWQTDVWAQRGADFGFGKIVASKDIVTDAELEHTEFHADWLREIGIFYLVGSVFAVSRDEIAILGIHRTRVSGGLETRLFGGVAGGG
ncbi:MAG: hypothetical protein KGL66_04585 [Alphaproteobacteria bacterium]|nr:hypothetical protein [Alphaproteobacteria bacterium]